MATLPKMNGDWDLRITQVVLVPKGKEIFDEMATIISIVDEAAGEYVTIEQEEKIGIAPEEWPNMRAAIDFMVKQCRE